jgi:membrane protein implicated in regulation of membrane protease activity
MQHWLNQHSFLVAAAAAFVVLAALLVRDGAQLGDLVALAALALALALAYRRLRPGVSSRRESDAVRAEIGRGLPVLLEFQSTY